MSMEGKNRLNLLIPIALLLALSGCAGGGSNGGFLTRALRLSINWGGQSGAAVDSPPAAQSARIVLTGADPNGGAIVLTVNRPVDANGPVTGPVAYQIPSGARVGNYPVMITYFSAQDTQGQVLAATTATVSISSGTVDLNPRLRGSP